MTLNQGWFFVGPNFAKEELSLKNDFKIVDLHFIQI